MKFKYLSYRFGFSLIGLMIAIISMIAARKIFYGEDLFVISFSFVLLGFIWVGGGYLFGLVLDLIEGYMKKKKI